MNPGDNNSHNDQSDNNRPTAETPPSDISTPYVAPSTSYQPSPDTPTDAVTTATTNTGTHEGDKQFLAAWLFSLLLGVFGVDRFYLGKIGTGIVKLITVGGVGVWALIDLILLLSGATRDKQGNRLAGYEEYKTIALIATVLLLVVYFVFGKWGTSNQPANNPPTPPAYPSQTTVMLLN